MVAQASLPDVGLESRLLPSDANALRFAASFFHAYVSAKQADESAHFLLLLGASAYYFSDLAGSAAVLLREAQNDPFEPDNFIAMMQWTLSGNWSTDPILAEDGYAASLRSVADIASAYFSSGTRRSEFDGASTALRDLAYRTGTDRELLIGDIIVAILKKRQCNAARHVLPLYSGLSDKVWAKTFERSDFMKELWPAQHVFG